MLYTCYKFWNYFLTGQQSKELISIIYLTIYLQMRSFYEVSNIVTFKVLRRNWFGKLPST